MKHLCIFLCLGVLAGCAAVQSPAPPSSVLSTTSMADLRAQAYQAGMEAALRAYGEHYLDNDFPYYNWSPPLVQRVWVPASIQGGVFIPGHMAEVIIKPGAWKREFAAPLSTRTSPADARPHTHERPGGCMADLFTRIKNRGYYLAVWLASRPRAVRVSLAVLVGIVVVSLLVSRQRPTQPEHPQVDIVRVPETARFVPAAEAGDAVPAQDPAAERQWYQATVSPAIDDQIINPFTGDSLAAEQTARTAKRQLDAKITALEIANYDLKIAHKQKEAALIRREIRALHNPPRPPASPQLPPLPPAQVVAVTNAAALVTVGARRTVLATGQTFYGWTVLRCDPHGVQLTFREHHTVIPLVFAQSQR